MALEDVIPVNIETEGECKGCRLGFPRTENEGRWYHEWEGRAYPCLTIAKRWFYDKWCDVFHPGLKPVPVICVTEDGKASFENYPPNPWMNGRCAFTLEKLLASADRFIETDCNGTKNK